MSESVPTVTTAAPVVKPSFKVRSQLLLKKYQNINGKGMDPIAGENAAREALGLPALTEAEIAKLQQREHLMQKMTDSKAVKFVTGLAFFQKLQAKVTGQPSAPVAPATPAPAAKDSLVASVATPATPVVQNSQTAPRV